MNIFSMPEEEHLRETLITLVEDAYIDAIDVNNCRFKICDVPSGLNHFINLQYCYDEEYNRIFIEFELSKSIKTSLPWEKIVASIHNYINEKFRKETHVYPEIIAYDDDVNERYDSVTQLSPYTIGYWTCLHGHYEFIYSHQVFMSHMSGLNIPAWSEDFIKEMDENFAMNYVSNYPKFLDEMVNIKTKYKIDSDQAPEKKIEDFADMVQEIYHKYLKGLTEEEKDSYIKEFMDVCGDPEKMKEINKKYGISEPVWKKIPEIMEDYKKIYEEFFGVKLHDFISNTKRLCILIYD